MTSFPRYFGITFTKLPEKIYRTFSVMKNYRGPRTFTGQRTFSDLRRTFNEVEVLCLPTMANVRANRTPKKYVGVNLEAFGSQPDSVSEVEF